jgi:Flp pilus assembly pilin Flp
MLKFIAFAHSLTLEGTAAARSHFKNEKGQTMAEYGVILAVITVGIIVALTFLSSEIRNALTAVAGRLDGKE